MARSVQNAVLSRSDIDFIVLPFAFSVFFFHPRYRHRGDVGHLAALLSEIDKIAMIEGPVRKPCPENLGDVVPLRVLPVFGVQLRIAPPGGPGNGNKNGMALFFQKYAFTPFVHSIDMAVLHRTPKWP